MSKKLMGMILACGVFVTVAGTAFSDVKKLDAQATTSGQTTNSSDNGNTASPSGLGNPGLDAIFAPVRAQMGVPTPAITQGDTALQMAIAQERAHPTMASSAKKVTVPELGIQGGKLTLLEQLSTGFRTPQEVAQRRLAQTQAMGLPPTVDIGSPLNLVGPALPVIIIDIFILLFLYRKVLLPKKEFWRHYLGFNGDHGSPWIKKFIAREALVFLGLFGAILAFYLMTSALVTLIPDWQDSYWSRGFIYAMGSLVVIPFLGYPVYWLVKFIRWAIRTSKAE